MRPLHNFRAHQRPFPVSDWGKWSTGPVKPKRLVPMHSGYSLSRQWRWRAIHFTAFEHEHIAILCHKMRADPPIPEIRMILFSKPESGSAIAVCRVEYHPSHPGWHVHYQPHKTMQKGVIRPRPEFHKYCPKNWRVDLQSSVETIELSIFSSAVGIFGLQQYDSEKWEMD